MNKHIALVCVVFSLVLSLSASAQDTHQAETPKQEEPKGMHVESFVKRLTISGEFRTRFEFRDPLGYANAVQLEESQDLLHIRVRLNFDVQVTDHLRGFVQIQDQRFAGQEPVSVPASGNPLLPFSTASGDGKNTDVHQAYIEIQDMWDEDLDLRIGRFNMCYGSRRLLCNFDYHPVGNTWDGVHGHYGKDKFWIDGWYTIVQERNAPVTAGASIEDASDDVDFWGFYSQYQFGTEFAVEGFLFARRAQFDVPPAGQNPYEDETYGLRIFGKAGGFDYEAEFALQTGTNSPTGLADLDKDAKGGAAMVGYTFGDLPLRPRLAVEYTYASGDKDPADGNDESFSPPYPGAHIYNGYADQVAMRNIREWKFIVQAEPFDDTVIQVDYFLFDLDRVEDAWFNFLQVPIRPGDPTGAASKDLGTELDLHARWTYDQKLSFWGGLCWFWPGGFVEDTAGTDKSMRWYFLQATLTF